MGTLRTTRGVSLALLAGLLTTGCEVPSEWLQRMEEQAKYEVYEENPFFTDRRSMREPPLGTIPREQPAGDPALTTGMVAGQVVQDIPMKLTPDMLLRGQHKYEVVCAQCHGKLGNGDSVVAENMPLRLPPSLITLAESPAGHFYRAITYGYGVMPSFAGEIRIEDRWAVVAYVRALQRSQNATLADVPADKRSELERKETLQ